MRKKYPQLSQQLYLRPDVHIHVEDGRSFVRRSPEKYQVIQATLVDTWASTAAGAFALSENNLYTTDAFRDYLSHLTDDGLLTFTRWGFDPPRESLAAGVAGDRGAGGVGRARSGAARVGGAFRSGKADLAGWGAHGYRDHFAQAVVRCRCRRRRGRRLQAAHMTAIYVPGDPIRERIRATSAGERSA